MHCLTSAGETRGAELDLRDGFRLIDALEEAKVLRLFLSGGEPFLHPHILEVIERLSESKMYFDIGTNGVDIPDAFYDRLPDYRLFLVQVSIDGIGERHDAFRGRRGAFTAASRTIERLQKADIDVTISTTATAANFGEMEAIIDWAASMGCASFKAITFIPAGRGKDNASSLKLTPARYRALSALLKRKQEELAPRMNVESGTTMSFLLDPCAPCEASSAEQRRDGPAHIGCAAGTDTLYIGADGTAYPCPFFRSFPLGNLLSTPLLSLWRDAPFLHFMRTLTEDQVSEECRKCRHLGVECNAGCRASAYLEHGDLHAMDPSCFKDR
jgi:Fe-coproporphyrin III synthase